MTRALLSLLLASPLLAQPSTVVYQGFLTSLDFVPVDDTVTLHFKLYTTPTGGTPVWLETVSDVDVSQGHFSAELNMAPSDLTQSDLYLGLAVNVQSDEMTPRQPIASAPWALLCADADLVAGVAGADVQHRVTGTCPGDAWIRGIQSNGAVDCETDEVGGGAVDSVTAGVGLLATGTTSVVVDINAGPGIVVADDEVALDFTGSSGTGSAAARADHGHFQYVPAAGTKTCSLGQLAHEVDPTGNVFCDVDQTSLRYPGPSDNIVLNVNDFQLNPQLALNSLTAGNYLLPAPKRYQFSVPPSAFHYKSPNSGDYRATSFYGSVSCDGCEVEVLAALHLPQGAQITGVDVTYMYGFLAGTLECWLHVAELTARAGVRFPIGVAPSGNPGVIQQYSASISPPPVDNDAYTYVAECYLYNDMALETNLYGFNVSYDLVELVR